LLAETVGDRVDGSPVCMDGVEVGTSDRRTATVGLSDCLVKIIGRLEEGSVLGAWGRSVGDSARPSDGTAVRSAAGRSVSAGGFTVGVFKGTALKGKGLGRTRKFVDFDVGSVVVCSMLGIEHCSIDGLDDVLLEGGNVVDADVDGSTDGACADETPGAFEVTNVFIGALVTGATAGVLVSGLTIGD
jgi:hypothetical protein